MDFSHCLQIHRPRRRQREHRWRRRVHLCLWDVAPEVGEVLLRPRRGRRRQTALQTGKLMLSLEIGLDCVEGSPNLKIKQQATCSVQTEAEFCPPAGARAPAHKLQGSPAGDEAPVTPLLHPKAPVTPEPLVITGGLKSS